MAYVSPGAICAEENGKSPLIFFLWEPGPLGILEVGVMCLLDEKWF